MKSIIIPTYNEEKNIKRVVKAISVLEDVEIIISDDGSTDATPTIGNSLAEIENIKFTSNEKKGKGAAIKRGLELASGDMIGFLDADMSAHPREFLKLIKEVNNGVDLAIGSRALPGAVIPVKQPIHRRLLGVMHRNLTQQLFKIDIMDFQCGLKFFKRKVWDNINIETDGFAFDVELIVRAHNKGYIIKEVPITWADAPNSKVNPISDSIKMFIDLGKIRAKIEHTPKT